MAEQEENTVQALFRAQNNIATGLDILQAVDPAISLIDLSNRLELERICLVLDEMCDAVSSLLDEVKSAIDEADG